MNKSFLNFIFYITLVGLASCKPTAKVAVVETGVEAELTSAESFSLNFGEKVLGGTYLGQVTLSNKGKFPISNLVASALDSTGNLTYSSGTYPGANGTCGTTILQNASCTIELEFKPDHDGNYTYNIALDFNTGLTSKKKNILVTAFAGTAAFLEFDSLNSDFGIHELTDQVERTFIIKNSGGLTARNLGSGTLEAPFYYKGGSYPGVGGTCGAELKSKNVCSVNIVLSPTAYEELLKSLSLDYHNGNNLTTLTASLQALIVSIEADVSFLVGGVQDFGSATLQKAVTKKFKLLNRGYLDATNLTFVGSSNFLTGTNTCGVKLEPSKFCEFDVTFFPTSVGTLNETFSVQFDTGKQVKSLQLSTKGVGVLPAVLTLDLMNSYSFGDQGVNSDNFLDLKLKNTGNYTATSVNFSFSNSEFTIDFAATTCGSIILKNVTCNVRIKFNPTVAGSKSANFIMSYNNGSVVVNSNTSVTGSSSALAYLVFWDADPNSGEYNFGLTFAGQVKAGRMLIKNIGLAAATNVRATKDFIDPSIYYRGDFDLSSLSKTISDYPNCGAMLEAGTICKDGTDLFYNNDLVSQSYTNGAGYINCAPTLPTAQICKLSTSGTNLNVHAYPGQRALTDYPICNYTIAAGETCQIILEHAPPITLTSMQSLYEPISLDYISDNMVRNDQVSTNFRFQGNVVAKLSYKVFDTIDVPNIVTGYTLPSYYNVGSKNLIPITVANTGGYDALIGGIDWTDSTRTHFKFDSSSTSIGAPGKDSSGLSGNCSNGMLLSAGSACTIYIWFTPGTTGSLTDILNINYDNGTNSVVDNFKFSAEALLMGNLINYPSVSLLSNSYYGVVLNPVAIQIPGNSVSRSFTLKNIGSANLTMNSIALCAGLDYQCLSTFQEGTLDSSPGTSCQGATVAPGNTCTINLLYSPLSLHSLNFLTVKATYTTAGHTIENFYFASLDSAYPSDLRFTDAGSTQSNPYDYKNVEYLTTSTHDFIVQNVSGQIDASSVTFDFTNNASGVFTINSSQTTCTSSLNASSICIVSVNFIPSNIGTFTANLNVRFHNGAENKVKTIIINGTGEPPESTHKGWSSIFAIGDKVNTSNISDGSQFIKLSWADMVPKAGFTITGYNIYRRDGNGFYGGGSAHDYSTPLNNTNVISTAVKSYTDTTAIAGKVYYYEVRPVIVVLGNPYTTKTAQTFREVRITAPIPNTVFIHRWMANSQICLKLGKTTDPANNYRCSYAGTGSTFNYYDMGSDLLVDRFEIGQDKTSRPGQYPLIDTQKNVYSACQQQDDVTIFNISSAVLTKTFKKRLLNKKEFNVSSMWSPSDTDTTIVSKEAGARSGTSCNSSGTVEVTGSNLQCKSYFGIEDAAGNELEWLSDRAVEGVGLTDQMSVTYGVELRLDTTNKVLDSVDFSTVIPSSLPHLPIIDSPCFNIAIGMAVPLDPNTGTCSNSRAPSSLGSAYFHNNLYSVSSYTDLRGIGAGGASYLSGTSGVLSTYWVPVSTTIGGRCVVKLEY